MPRQSFDIREVEQLSIEIRKILVFLINQMHGNEMQGKKVVIHWKLKKVLPYVVIISIS